MLYRYLDAQQGVWRSGDYHALRFAGWVAVQGRSLVGVSPPGAQAVVPFAQRWPLLHERCLVLAGGLLPRWSAADGARVLIYTSVGRDLLTRLATKLPFDLQEAEHA
jgi:hypothetical protein